MSINTVRILAPGFVCSIFFHHEKILLQILYNTLNLNLKLLIIKSINRYSKMKYNIPANEIIIGYSNECDSNGCVNSLEYGDCLWMVDYV